LNPLLLDIRHATVAVGGGKRVLEEITLAIRAGEHTAVLGPNGSGKSSLIKLIAHQYYPHTGGENPGTVKVFGGEKLLIDQLRRRIGIVSADLLQYFPIEWKALRADDAVLSGLLGGYDVLEHHAITREMREKARAAEELMGILHLSHRPITQLSTGELRRVLIARALAPDPDALLLDEPTTGLDLVTRQHFLETLRSVAARGKTILLVTHHVEEILPEIERVVLLRDGRVFRDGAKREMLTGGMLSETFGAPVRVEAGGNGYYSAHAL
jgi:iron complex transport system ATP-binding protein